MDVLICGQWSLKRIKSSRQQLYHLTQLRKIVVSYILKTFYTCAAENILTGNITNCLMLCRVWFVQQYRKLCSRQDTYIRWVRLRVLKIIDSSHGPFRLLRSANTSTATWPN